ncbi:hypothetical protein L0152_03200 [bacterium]|nr:hypothetical protein [bacterium]
MKIERGICFLFMFFVLLVCPVAADVQIEKQKLKLSLEYENYVDLSSNEIRTTGIKATYLLKAKGSLIQSAYWTLDLQSGAKTNFDRTFSVGNLSPLIWSNRLLARTIFPAGRFSFGGGFYYRNKWLADSSDPDLFVDIFGGVGFSEMVGSLQAGYSISPNWEMLVSAQKSKQRFKQYPLSDSDSIGGSARLSRNFVKARLSVEFRMRSVDFRRPVFSSRSVVTFPIDFIGQELQHDSFYEAGVNVELMRPFYLSGGYFYQDNNSNNSGFSYTNHRVTLLIGTELSEQFHFQAYGILQNQDFADTSAILQVPVLLEESENNTMAASLIRTLGTSKEIEIGFQRLSYNSSFTELDTSKYVLYLAYNYRF